MRAVQRPTASFQLKLPVEMGTKDYHIRNTDFIGWRSRPD
jgi:hypothetical protein